MPENIEDKIKQHRKVVMSGIVTILVLVVLVLAIIHPFNVQSTQQKPNKKPKTPSYKIYARQNEKIIDCWKEKCWGGYYYPILLSDGDIWILYENGYAFYLTHNITTIDIFRWSGSFLDLDRHWYVAFKSDNINVTTFPITR